MKKLILLLLIGSIFVNTGFASASADGSAFITKQEFDAAMSDFNTRLTIFEAGINSKIDSQVTSYLDRNGIWNPSKQTFVQNTAKTGVQTDGVRHWGWYKKLTRGEPYILGRGSQAYKWFTAKTYPDVKLIDNITKSGLAYLQYKRSELRVGALCPSADDDLNSCNGYVSLTMSIVLVEKSGTEEKIVDNLAFSVFSAVPTSLVVLSASGLNSMFFVSKGYSLYARSSTEYGAVAGLYSSDTNPDSKEVTWTFDSMEIY